MSGLSVFGPLVDGEDVERQVIAHLRAWEPTHRAEIERRRASANGWSQGLAPIRDYRVTHAADEKWPENKLPMIIVHSPGLAAPPRRHADGSVFEQHAVGVIVVATGKNQADAKAVARAHLAIAKLSILQHRALSAADEPFATGVSYLDGRNGEVTRGVEHDRSLFSASAVFSVEVKALDTNAGTREPLEDPETEPADPPTATETSVTVGFPDD